MSDSTTHLDTISTSQANKEVTANELFDALSPSLTLGRRASTCSGLTWGYYGGKLILNGAITNIANGTVALTGSTTNYVECNTYGVVSKNTTGFTAGYIPMYSIVTSASGVSSYTDKRAPWYPIEGLLRKYIGSPDANITLTMEESLCQTIEIIGTPASELTVTVPPVPRTWTFYANTSGFGIAVINSGSPQSSVSIGAGKTAIVRASYDGVHRVTADNP